MKMHPERLKMHQKAFDGRALHRPLWELKHSPYPLTIMRVPTSKGEEKRKEGEGE